MCSTHQQVDCTKPDPKVTLLIFPDLPGTQEQPKEAPGSMGAGGGEPARTMDVPAAGQPIRQNQAAVRERLMPKLAELEQVCLLSANHNSMFHCQKPPAPGARDHELQASAIRNVLHGVRVMAAQAVRPGWRVSQPAC